MIIFMNPGAEPIEDPSSPEQAAKNMEQLVADIGFDARFEPIIDPVDDLERDLQMGGTKYEKIHDGRWPFRVWMKGQRHLVEMPGIPLDRVRYMKSEDQNIWDFPRLFVDGSSWVWLYALRQFEDK